MAAQPSQPSTKGVYPGHASPEVGQRSRIREREQRVAVKQLEPDKDGITVSRIEHEDLADPLLVRRVWPKECVSCGPLIPDAPSRGCTVEHLVKSEVAVLAALDTKA